MSLVTLGRLNLRLDSLNAIYVTEQLESAIRGFAEKYVQAKGNPQAVEALMSVRNEFNGLIALTVFYLVDICYSERDPKPALSTISEAANLDQEI